MAAAERNSAKRYGVRYGARLRNKISKIEKERRDSNNCPYCHYNSLSRVVMGIWYCKKCKSKFTGRAYAVGKKLVEVETPEVTEG